MINPY